MKFTLLSLKFLSNYRSLFDSKLFPKQRKACFKISKNSKKKLLWVILLLSFVCGAENEMSFSQQEKPLILAKNDKSLSNRRKKRAKSNSKTAPTEVPEEDTKTEAENCPAGCGGGEGRASDQKSQFAILQEAGEALKKASTTNNLAFLPVCERTKQIKEEIERLLKKSCEDITKDDLLKITSLDVSGRRIKSLKPGDFSGLVNLKELDLGHNYINKLPPELFYDLKELTKLNLYCVSSVGCDTNVKESLHSLDKDQFKYNTKLKNLNIGGNDLGSLHKDLFTHNTKLTELDIGDNRLTRLDKDQFKTNTELTKLSLYDNKLNSLDKDQFKTNTELTKLSLGRNWLGSLDKDQFRYNTKLTSLNLHYNSLGIKSSLDKDQFRYNIKLTNLDLYANKLSSLDKDQFKHNTQLTKLDLGANQYLNNLDKDQFKTNTELTYLDLSGTGGIYGLRLHKDFFKNNAKLTNLSFPVFSAVYHPDPDLLQYNTNLENLSIEFRSDQSGRKRLIPENLLANATKLETFRLGSDGSSKLPEKLFEKKSKLKKCTSYEYRKSPGESSHKCREIRNF